MENGRVKKKNPKTDRMTNSQDRLFEMLLRAKRSRGFNGELKSLRKEIGIPEGGFPEKPENYNLLGYRSFAVPKEWARSQDMGKAQKKIDSFLDENSLGFFSAFPQVGGWIVFYDTYILPDSVNSVVLKDMVKSRKERTPKREENHAFPVAILISPHASKRDIEEFVDRNFGRIKILQNKYLKKSPDLPSVRLRDVTRTTRFIQSLDGKKTAKQIAILANKKFETSRFNEFDVSRVLNKGRRKSR